MKTAIKLFSIGGIALVLMLQLGCVHFSNNKSVSGLQYQINCYLYNQDCLDRTSIDSLTLENRYDSLSAKLLLYKLSSAGRIVSLNESIDSIFTLQHFNDILFIKDQLRFLDGEYGTENHLSLECILLIANYYYSDNSNQDSSTHYNNLLFDRTKYAKNKTVFYYAAIHGLTLDYLSKRNNVESNLLTELYRDENDVFNFNNRYRSIQKRLQGYCKYRDGEFDESVPLLKQAVELADSNSVQKQESYKYLLSTLIQEKYDVRIVDSLLISLQSEIDRNGDYLNFSKLVGQKEYYSKNYKEAIEFLEEAFYYNVNRKPYNSSQSSAILWYLAESYLNLNEYDKAMGAFFTEHYSKTPKRLYEFSYDEAIDSLKMEESYYFLVTQFYARTFLRKFQVEGQQYDLDMAYDISMKSRPLIQNELNTVEEKSVIEILKNAELTYDVLLQILLLKYNENKDKKYLDEYVQVLVQRSRPILNNLLYNAPKSKVIDLQKSLIEGPESAESALGTMEQLREIGKLSQLENDKEIVVDSIQQLLEPDESWLDLRLIDNDLYLLVIDKKNIVLDRIKVSSGDYKSIRSLLNIGNEGENIPIDSLKYHGGLFYEKFVANRIGTNNSLVIFGDALMDDLCFDCLYNRTDLAFLFEKHKVRRGSSIKRSMLLAKNEHKQRIEKVGAFFYSNKATLINANHLNSVPELPGNLGEAKSIRAGYAGANNIYSGKDCTLNNFYNEARLSRMDLLHLGVHGQSQMSNLYDNFLLFRDGRQLDTLYGYEFLDFESLPPYVILSTCNSGDGIQTSVEGRYSLTRSLLSAGVRKVISVNGNLEDVTAQKLYSHFYNSLDISTSEALNAAKIELLSDGAIPVLTYIGVNCSE